MNRPTAFVLMMFVMLAAACATAPNVPHDHDDVNAVLDGWHRAAA